MINDKRVLAIIPARGGSKGLPGKNIRSFCGKPLIAWPIGIAKQSKYVDKVLVSTDAEDIGAVAQEYEAEVSWRPDELASDTAIVADMLRYIINETRRNGENYDIIVLLEATSPMRTLEMVDECIEKLDSEKYDSVATFSESDPPPTRLWKIENGLASTFLPHANPWLPRQQQEVAYHLNGLVYGFKISKFLEENSTTLFVGKGAAVITDVQCVDIDTLDDFELAEMLLGKQK